MTTVEEVLKAVLGSPNKGTPARRWVKMTATRYGHLADLLRRGVPPGLVRAAEQRINASSWLRKPVDEVTAEDVAGLLRDRPWEAKGDTMTGKQIVGLMRAHKVTIKQLSERLGVTMKRIREVREQGLTDANTIRDWVQGITVKDPGPQAGSAATPGPAPRAAGPAPEPMPSAERVTGPDVARPDLLLPRNLARLADLAAGRAGFATAGVFVAATADGYRAEATDGRRLAVVTGPNAADPEGWGYVPDLAEAQRGAGAAVVPVRDWEAAFATRPNKGLLRLKPQLAPLAVALGKDRVTLATAGLRVASLTRAEPEPGRWPPTARLLTEVVGRKVQAEVRVDAKLLAELLEVAAAFAEGDCHGVTLRVYEGGAKYLSVHAANGEGQQFTGLIVPLADA